MAYQVDNVPKWLFPFYWLGFAVLGTAAFFLYWFIHQTLRIKFVDRRGPNPPPHSIFAIWHEDWIPYFVCFQKNKNHVWISHSAWYMKHVFIVLWWIGVRHVIHGSTGHRGRPAADELVQQLKRGKSTVLAPDGPYGPVKELKKGILHMAKQSQLPIVPLKFALSRSLVLPFTWDGKRVPLPFSKITVFYGSPIWITEENFEGGLRTVTQALNASESGQSLAHSP